MHCAIYECETVIGNCHQERLLSLDHRLLEIAKHYPPIDMQNHQKQLRAKRYRDFYWTHWVFEQSGSGTYDRSATGVPGTTSEPVGTSWRTSLATNSNFQRN